MTLKLGILTGQQEVFLRGKRIGWIVFEGVEGSCSLEFEQDVNAKVSKKTMQRVMALMKRYAEELTRGN